MWGIWDGEYIKLVKGQKNNTLLGESIGTMFSKLGDSCRTKEGLSCNQLTFKDKENKEKVYHLFYNGSLKENKIYELIFK